MTAALGLLAALFWGLTDFLGGPAARRVGVAHVVLVSNVIGLIAIGTVLGVSRSARDGLFAASGIDILLSVASALSLLAATTTLSRGLRSGKASIIAPIAMSYGVVTTLLSYFSGEKISTIHLVGMSICMLGIPLTGISFERASNTRDSTLLSVTLAIIAMMCFGVSYWLQGRFAVPKVGKMGYLFINYTCISFLAVAYVLVSRFYTGNNRKVAPLQRYPLVIAQGVASLLGLVCFSWGLASGTTAVVAVLSTFSGGITALLARVFRKEKLHGIQWLGISIVILGACVIQF